MKITNNKDVPRSALRKDFAAYTMAHVLNAKKRALRFNKLTQRQSQSIKQEGYLMKLRYKPFYAALTMLVVAGISGTAYAAANGGISSITALFGGEKKMTGARIVKVDLQNCHDVNAFNVVSGTGKGNTPRYYRIADNANISNKKMTDMAQSICRASYYPSAEKDLYEQIANVPQNKDKLVGNASGTIVGLSDSTIDIQISGDVTGNSKPFVEHFTRIDPDVMVLDGSGVSKKLNALKIGDTVDTDYRASGDALTKSESTSLDAVDWSQQVLVVVTKQSPDEKVYNEYKKLTRSGAIEQVAPCDNGYCTFEQLQK